MHIFKAAPQNHHAGRQVSTNPNLLTFYLVAILAPFEFILVSLGGPSVSASAAEILELICLAIAFICLGQDRIPQKGWISLRFLAALWFALCAVAILYLTLARGASSLLAHASTGALLLLPAGLLLAAALWRSSPRYHNLLAFLGATLFPALFATNTVDLMKEAIHYLPYVYDPVLYRIDTLLVSNLNKPFADLLNRHAVLKYLVIHNYNYFLLWTMLAAVSQWLNTPPSRAYLPLCSFIVGIFGFCLYYLMPAVAPFYFFGGQFPDHLPPSQILPLHLVLSPIASFRNTMPSLHTASALLIYLALGNSPAWQRVAGAFLVLFTMFSVLALGEHYAVDLIAAFPLVLLGRGISAIALPFGTPSRRNAIMMGGMLIGLWVLTVRCASVSLEMPGLIRLLACLSLAAPILLERELAKTERFSPLADGPAYSPAVVA